MGSLRKYVFENGEEPQLHTGSVEVGYCVRTFTFLGQFARATRAPPRPRSTPDLWKYSTGSCLSTFFFSRMGRSPRSTSALWRYGMGSLRKYFFKNGEEPPSFTPALFR